jgi:hypothetical protein
VNEILNKNLIFLSQHFPDLFEGLSRNDDAAAFSFTPSPEPNIYFKNRPFHSKADPLKEALNLVKGLTIKPGNIFIFMGIGLGFHIETFIEMYGIDTKNTTIIAVEKSIEAFLILINNRDISFLEGAYLFINREFEQITGFFEKLDPLSFKGYRIIRLRGAFAAFSDYYTELEDYFKNLTSGKLSDILTRFAFESLWMKNIIENVPYLIEKKSINILKNSLLNKPVLITGAGPSLLGQMETIKKVSEHIHLISVDTALEPLLKSGIKPDVIVTLDAQFYNLFDFFSILKGQKNSNKMKLVADTTTYPKILKYWPGDLYFSESVSRINEGDNIRYVGHPLMEYLSIYLPPFDPLECGGSVTTTAIELALYLGADPVIVAGFDLSYTSFMTHINSSAFYTLFSAKETRLQNLQTSMIDSIRKRKLQRVQGVNGDPVLSDFIFLKYMDWIKEKDEYKNRVFNATCEGAIIPNLTHIGLEESLLPRLLLNKKTPIPELSGEKVSKKRTLEFLGDIKKEITKAREALENSLVSEAGVSSFLKTYPFLKNILLEVRALYSKHSSVYSHMVMFLNLMEKQINRSVKMSGDNRD